MPFYDTVWYCNAGDQATTGHYAVAKRPQNAAVTAGQIVRQFTAPAVGSERCFICIVAGTTANVADATWVLTRGAKTTDGTATWQECTGASAVNGDTTNTVNWTQAKAAGNPTLGAIIKRNSGASYQICTTAVAMGASEPAFSNTAGVTTTDGSCVWTCLGPVGNFTGGQAPHARLVPACAANWFAAGNTIYVGDNHAESQTTLILLQPTGSASTVSKIICHNHSGSYPPGVSDIASTATVTTTAAAGINLSPASAGAFYLYGLTFRSGVGQSTAAVITLSLGGGWFYADNCLFDTATTNATNTISVGSGSFSTCIFNNTTVKFAATGQNILLSLSQFIWQNTGQILAGGSSIPTNLFTCGTACTPVLLEALDLSQLTGNILFMSGPAVQGNLILKDCKLNATTSIATPTCSGSTLQVIRSDAGATAHKSSRYMYEGTETTETSITRVGGASDPTGQVQARKIVTTAFAQWTRPFRAEPYAVWNDTTAANVTVTVYGTGTGLPNNDDIWLEVEYLGSSASPLGTFVTTTKANLLATNAAVASDSSTWSGGGGSPFKLTKTISSPQPGQAGYIHARVRVGKASATYYIDPQVYLS